MKKSLIIKYFLLAVVIMGSIGVWLPILLTLYSGNIIDATNVIQNIITYFVTIIFAGCIDYFFSKLKTLNKDRLAESFLNIVIIILVCFGITITGVSLNISGKTNMALLLAIIGVISSYIMWWLANRSNSHFVSKNPTAPTGGSTEKKLING